MSDPVLKKKILNGIVNVNKPIGITSFKTVSIVRRLFEAKKAGHTGTLDPLASGVLPICIGKATRIGQFLLSSNKVYHGIMKLGSRTDTQDAEGKILERCDNYSVDEKKILKVFSNYTGKIEQIPPMFSAKKINGKKLYQLARKGIELEREPKTVNISSLAFLGFEKDEIRFRAKTSPGTYIRTLCDSIGQDLGCLGHLKSLVREKVGDMDISDALTIDQLKELKQAGRLQEVLFGMKEALSFYPLIHVDEKAERDILKGRMISKRGIGEIEGSFKAQDTLRVIGPSGKLVALVESLLTLDDYKKLGMDVPVMKSKKVFCD